MLAVPNKHVVVFLFNEVYILGITVKCLYVIAGFMFTWGSVLLRLKKTHNVHFISSFHIDI